MKKFINKILLLTVIISFSISAKAIDFKTLKTEIYKDIEDQKDMPNLINIWNQVIANGYYDLGTSNDQTREEVTKIQAIIELHLSKLPRDDAEAYIITPLPPTPLRMIGMANPFCQDGKTLCPSFSRTNTLRQFISSGHPIELVYSNIGDDIPGITTFKSLVSNNPNILTTLVNEVPDTLQGATYYFKLDDDKYMFSICGNQKDSTSRNKWQIWFGQQDTDLNLRRTTEIFEFVKPLSR